MCTMAPFRQNAQWNEHTRAGTSLLSRDIPAIGAIGALGLAWGNLGSGGPPPFFSRLLHPNRADSTLETSILANISTLPGVEHPFTITTNGGVPVAFLPAAAIQCVSRPPYRKYNR